MITLKVNLPGGDYTFARFNGSFEEAQEYYSTQTLATKITQLIPDKHFEIDGKAYETDKETLDLLREQIAAFKAGNKGRRECITAIMTLGLQGGRIKEVC